MEAALLVRQPVFVTLDFQFHTLTLAKKVMERVIRSDQVPMMVKVRDHFVEPSAALTEYDDFLDVCFVRSRPHQ